VPCVAWPPPASDQAVSAGRDRCWSGFSLIITAKSWSSCPLPCGGRHSTFLYYRHLSSC